MGALAYWGAQIGLLVLTAVLLVAVVWEANHLLEWANTMYQAHGDGSAASYRRYHAYTYVSWLFGTDFGWVVE